MTLTAKYLEYRFTTGGVLFDVVELEQLPPDARRMAKGTDVWGYGTYGKHWSKIKPIGRDYDFGTGVRTLAEYLQREYGSG